MSEAAGAVVPLYARDEGSGPTVVLLHGVGGDHTVWNSVAPELARQFRVISVDLRGHGRSTAPASATYSFADLERDLLALLEAKGVGPVHLVGLSAGAQLALRLALDEPDRVRSLTMVGGAAYTDGHARSVGERWAETYAREGPDALAVRLLKDLYYPDWIEAHMDFADHVREEIPGHDFGSAVRWAREVASFDERKRIATLRPPALIVQAMDDQVIDPSHGRILRQSIPGSRIRIFAQAGHMLPIEKPAETAQAIAEFVHEVEGRPAA